MTYERPTLTRAGGFRKVTGVKNTGPRTFSAASSSSDATGAEPLSGPVVRSR